MRVSTIFSFVAAVALPIGVSASVRLALLEGAQEAIASEAKGPTPPSKDPFYTAPKGFEKKSPGTILRHRPVPYPLLVGPTLNAGYYDRAYQIVYRTTDGLGNPSFALSTLIVPKKGDPSKLLSYQTFYDAADVDCSPSYTLQKGQNNLNIEGVIISSALRQGWWVTVSDYEGPKAAFTVGRQAGHATLDGVRATINSRSFSKIDKSPKVALFGYSGGALASEWAVELQPSYAPKLKIATAAFGGLTPNVTSVIEAVNDTPNSNLIPTGILGFSHQYKNVSAFLRKSLKPATASEFRLPARQCNTGKLSNKDILAYFKNGKSSLNSPIFKSVVNQNGIMGKTNIPTIPLYIYKSTGDEVSPIEDNDKLVKHYCNKGASIRYVRNKFGSHETEFVIGLPHAYSWIKSVFDGGKPKKGCSTRNENQSKLQKHAAKILGKTVYQELKAELPTLPGGGGKN